MQPLTDQVAVVTGSAQGIGRAIASVLAAEGAHVVIADIDAEAANATAAELGREGKEALAVPCDVRQRASVEELAATVLSAFGRIDILAANAGIYPNVELAEIDDTLWDHVMDINVKGALHAIQACTPAMVVMGLWPRLRRPPRSRGRSQGRTATPTTARPRSRFGRCARPRSSSRLGAA